MVKLTDTGLRDAAAGLLADILSPHCGGLCGRVKYCTREASFALMVAFDTEALGRPA